MEKREMDRDLRHDGKIAPSAPTLNIALGDRDPPSNSPQCGLQIIDQITHVFHADRESDQ
jgi:hypothetical protein